MAQVARRAAEARRRFRPLANERQDILAPLRRRRAHVDQRARAPEAIEPVEHVLGQERCQRLDGSTGSRQVAPRPFDGVPIAKLDTARLPELMGTIQERRLAAEWLRGNATLMSDVSLDT